MKTFILTLAAAVALIFTGSDSAQAGGQFQVVIGNGGFGGYGGYGGGLYNGFGGGYGGLNQGHLHHDVNPQIDYGPGGHLDWHDTSHYDYIPGRWVQHGCHSHYIPGRRVLHQDGHFDLHH
jgi:hypothetical protein